jgi:glycogen(starch) synthase
MTADAVGGVWTYVLELADALEPLGVEVSLATMGPAPSPAQRAELERSTAVTALHVSDYALEWMDEPWEDVERAGDWLLELEAELAPDLVHLNGYAHGALPWTAPVVVAGHSCVLSWWEAVHREPPPHRLGRYGDAVARGLRGADLLVAPTHAFLLELERLYEPPCDRRVIPNGRRPVVARTKEPFILAAARAWDEAKNLAALDRVAGGLAWPVVIAGEAPPGSFRHAQPLGLLMRERLDDLMGRAAVFAAPALYEPFGYGPLEAASAGCALVLGAIPSLQEVWDAAGCFVAPGDDEALAAALAKLVSDEPRRTALSELARERAALYTPERMAVGYRRAYGCHVRDAYHAGAAR